MNARADAATLSPAEAFAEAVDARTVDLMAPGERFWPLDADNLAEALVEGLGEPGNPLKAKLAAALLGDVRSAKGCDLMRAQSEAYWKKSAQKQAEGDVRAAQRDALAASLEDRGDIRKWHADMSMVGWPGMS